MKEGGRDVRNGDERERREREELSSEVRADVKKPWGIQICRVIDGGRKLPVYVGASSNFGEIVLLALRCLFVNEYRT